MGKAKSTERRGKPNTSPYHVFFQRELKRVKQENPNMTHKEAFKQAGLNWKNSPENPKNKAPAPSNDQVPAGSSEKAPQAPAASLESSVPSNEQAQTTPFTASASSDAKEDVLAPPPKLPSPQSEQGGAANPQKLSANEHPASAAAASAEIETAEPKVAEPEPAETNITSTNPHTMFFKKTKKPSASTGGSLYVSASEFINYVSKDQISGPVAARPMGAMDITACDVICRGVPTSEELHLLRRRVRQTASALGTRANRSIEQSILV
ncbi:hypothetical protein LPJ68_003351 [Coemansia sp. RSA 1086]|nr:hypothetical protein LPJ68_003351 [Coemansia sp. RSA 1086]